jgi:hypothetical protein
MHVAARRQAFTVEKQNGIPVWPFSAYQPVFAPAFTLPGTLSHNITFSSSLISTVKSNV